MKESQREAMLQDINKKNTSGETPLHQVVIKGDLELTTFLIDHKARGAMLGPHSQCLLLPSAWLVVSARLLASVWVVRSVTVRERVVPAGVCGLSPSASESYQLVCAD
jgi:ankyrin repeat protein